MMSVLHGLIGRICLAYLDDVIVFSKRRAEHVNDLKAVLDRIQDAGLKLKPTKCKLFCEQVLYLGHIISAAGVSPDTAKLRVLAEWPLPTTVRELQSFLGFVNFYSDFIDEQTALTSSLYDLTVAPKGIELVNFKPEDVERFAELKRRLCVAPRLAHTTWNCRSRCTRMHQKLLLVQSSSSVTQQESNARSHSSPKSFLPR